MAIFLKVLPPPTRLQLEISVLSKWIESDDLGFMHLYLGNGNNRTLHDQSLGHETDLCIIHEWGKGRGGGLKGGAACKLLVTEYEVSQTISETQHSKREKIAP